MKINVLNKGFVKLNSCMGDWQTVVSSARVSYNGQSKGRDKDLKLLDYLIKHQHTTPFEMVQFSFHIKAPIFIARQWMRHRTGSFNEISARYARLEEEFYTPSGREIREPSDDNKQKSKGNSFNSKKCSEIADMYSENADMSYYTYKRLIDAGVAREQARMVLPTNVYTQFYWSVNMHNLLHFIKLRSASDAQYEMQRYAKAILQILKQDHREIISIYKEKNKL